jgi:hypothetical protein
MRILIFPQFNFTIKIILYVVPIFKLFHAQQNIDDNIWKLIDNVCEKGIDEFIKLKERLVEFLQ